MQVVDEAGVADEELMEPLSDSEMLKFFDTMLFVRTFNSRALSLHREGRLGTYASVLGQEASQVGSALALSKEDWVFPSYRETAVLLALGYPLSMILKYWRGDERGLKCPEGLNVLPMSIPVASQIPHATGVAMAMKIKGAAGAAVAYFGDGASSRGDFHEALNMAGVFKAPAVFICQNNGWAISLPREKQTSAATIAQKAIAYGIAGVQVDGNDIFAVHKATGDALKRGRDGGGPTLIECLTYRLDDHTTSDASVKYRDAREVEEWWRREPMIRLRKFLTSRALLTAEYEEEALRRAEEEVDRAIDEEERSGPPEAGDMTAYTNAVLTVRQAREMEELGWKRRP